MLVFTLIINSCFFPYAIYTLANLADFIGFFFHCAM